LPFPIAEWEVPTSFPFGRGPPLADRGISPIDQGPPGVALVGIPHHASPLSFPGFLAPINYFREDD